MGAPLALGGEAWNGESQGGRLKYAISRQGKMWRSRCLVEQIRWQYGGLLHLGGQTDFWG
jgi:hypothetical protein